MIEQILDHPIFEEEWFVANGEKEKDILITSLTYEIKSVQDSLLDVLDIAKGQDDLNGRKKHSPDYHPM
jgi:hypothetical protein